MKVGIIGATGYAGAELVRLLLSHPKIDELFLSSLSFEGENYESIYPNFIKRISGPLLNAKEAVSKSDIVFSALPHGAGEDTIKAAVEKGIPCIDLSADFRFGEDEGTFKEWYGKPYTYPELRKYSVYGLPELYRAEIQKLALSKPLIIANPGCYPTGAALGICPALAKGIAASSTTIIVDAASGTTGGGREPSRAFHYPECSDNIAPYKIGCHRHSPEIARYASAIAAINKRPAPKIIFTPHLVPMNRGILSTIYIPLAEEFQNKLSEIHKIYEEYYKNEGFIRILPLGMTASSNRVRHSNYCDISIHLDYYGTSLIVISAIDNMLKGASGQAVQNMNIILGFDEKTGLEMIPIMF